MDWFLCDNGLRHERVKLMASSQDKIFEETLVGFSYDRKKDIIKGAKNPTSTPVIQNIHPNKFLETTNYNYSEENLLFRIRIHTFCR